MSGTLSARSVIASTLLGTVPPRLPGRVLVALARLFAISEGTTRVALSRMVERGELVNESGTYSLAGELLARHHRQEEGLAPVTRPWDGSWVLHAVDGRTRSSAERAALRRAFRHLAVFEQREGVWLRPYNLDPDRLPDQRQIVAAQTQRFLARPERDSQVLAGELFDLPGWADRAADLEAEMDRSATRLDRDGHAALADGFEVAAAVLRHLFTDPLFPDELWPDGRPAERLRRSHADYDALYRAALADFLADPVSRP